MAARKKTIKTGAEGAKVKPLKDLQAKKDVKGGAFTAVEAGTHHVSGDGLLSQIRTHH